MVQQREILQDLRSLLRVGFHHGVLLVRQAGILVQHAVRYGDLADVVHVRRPFDLLAVLLAHAGFLGNQPGIKRNPPAVAARQLVLGVNGVGNGAHGLFTHFSDPVGFRQFPLDPFLPAFHQQPGYPPNREHGHHQQVHHKPAVVIQLLFLADAVGSFRQDAFLVVVKHRQPEGIVSRGQVGVHDGAQAVLRHDGPVALEALHFVSHVGILDGVVDHFRIDFQLSRSPGNRQRCVPLNPAVIPVHPYIGNVHPEHARSAVQSLNVDGESAAVAGQVKLSLFRVIPGPGVGGQGAVQAPAPVQQVAFDVCLPGKQLFPFRHINARAGQHIQVLLVLDPDVVVVVIREIVQGPDAAVRVHVAQSVAGHHKHAVALLVPHRPQDHLGAQAVLPGQHPGNLPVLQHRDSVSVRPGQDGSVRHLRQRQDHGGNLSVLLSDGVNDFMIPDIGQSRVAGGKDRTVRKLLDHPGPVSVGSGFIVVKVLCPVLLNFNQAAAVGADPEAAPAVRHHAADPDSGQLLRQLVADLLLSLLVRRVQALVCSEIVNSLPENRGVHHPVGHARRAVDIPEVRGRHPEKAQPGGGKPHVPLVVHQHVVHRVVEAGRVQAFKASLRGAEADAVVRGDEQHSRVLERQVLDAHQVPAGPYFLFLKPVFGNIEAVDLVPRGCRQQVSLRVKGTAFEGGGSARQPPGAEDLALPDQVQHPAAGHRGNPALVVRGAVVRVHHFAQRRNPLHSVIQRKHLHAGGGADIVVSVGAADNGPHGVGRQAHALVHNVGNLFIDQDGKPVVVGSDPQASLLVHIQAVHIPDGLIIVHPPELLAVVAVQSRVGADPEDAVIGLGNVVGFAAGQAVGAGIDGLHIIVELDLLGAFRPGFPRRSGKAQGKRQQQRPEMDRGRFFFLHQGVLLRLFLVFPVPAPVPHFLNQPVQVHQQVQHQQDQQLVQQLHIQLAHRQGKIPGKPPLRKIPCHRVAPHVAGAVVAEDDVQRQRQQGGRNRQHGCRGQDAQHAPEAFPPRRNAHHDADADAHNGVSPAVPVYDVGDQVSGSAHQRAAYRPAQVGSQHRSGGIQPQRQLVR